MIERVKSKRVNANGNGHAAWTADEWAGAIKESWQKAVESIINTGRLLIEAKATLRAEVGHGAWGEMIEKLPFSHRTADYLMEIARHPVIGNSQFVANLPPSWGTLADLATLPEEAVKNLIATGKINCEMRRTEAAEIIKAHNEEGLYKFADFAAACNTIRKFRLHWSSPDAIADEMAEHAWGEAEPYLSLEDMPSDSKFIADLYAALASKREQMEQLWKEEDEAELKQPAKEAQSKPRATFTFRRLAAVEPLVEDE